VHLCRECALRVPNLQMPHLWLASAYAQSGQLQEAREQAAEVLRINPAFTIESWKRLAVFKKLKNADHRRDMPGGTARELKLATWPKSSEIVIVARRACSALEPSCHSL